MLPCLHIDDDGYPSEVPSKSRKWKGRFSGQGTGDWRFIKECPYQAKPQVASSPGSLLKSRGRREPGNIRGKSCRLPAPCSGGTNQIAERNQVHTWHFVHSAKNCQLEMNLWVQKVDKKQFLDVQKSRESKIEVHCSWFAGPNRSQTSQFRVYMHKVLHGTQRSCGCLEDEEWNCK